MLGNKALWKWPEPGAEASQGVKSTVTARILRFVTLPVTALKGVHIPEGMKSWERLVLNAKSLFRQSFTIKRDPWLGQQSLAESISSAASGGACCRDSQQRAAREDNRQEGEGKAEGN